MSRPTASKGVPLGAGGCEKGHFLAGCEIKALRDGSNGFISFESIDPLPTISDHTGDEAVFWPTASTGVSLGPGGCEKASSLSSSPSQSGHSSVL